MNRGDFSPPRPPLSRWVVLLFLLLSAVSSPAAAADIEWNTATDRIRLSIEDWPVEKVLTTVAATTGWQVWIEPGMNRRVTLRIADRPAAEALRLIAGDCSYSLVTEPGTAPRLMVFRSDATKATQQIAAGRVSRAATREKDSAIANELIVTLKTNVSPEAVAGKLGAKIKGRIDAANAYQLEFPDAAAAEAARAALEADENIADVDSNYSIARPDSPMPANGGAALPFTLSPSVGGDGSQLIVGLIDSGVQTLGPDFAAFLLPALSIEPGYQPPGQTPGHGTSMAETILRGIDIATRGESSNVRVLPVDVYGRRENTSTFDLAWGISSAIERGATVINLSLGTDQPSALLETLIRNSTEKGVVFLAAAGNTPTTAPTYPAAYPQVTAVTAGSPNGQVASFANRGTFVDAMGPATALVNYSGTTWVVSGTSPATAFMSGITAGLASTSGAPPATAVQSVVRQFPFNTGLAGGSTGSSAGAVFSGAGRASPR